jgi:hypothetical protein
VNNFEDAGKPQLDYRGPSNGIGVLCQYAPNAPNVYGGAINHGNWRGFSVPAGSRQWANVVNDGSIINLGPSMSPKIIALERQAMNNDDALAAKGMSPIADVQLSGSGIFWGPESTQKSHWPHIMDRLVTSDPVKHRSYLKGPVTFTCDYIRFDGPISRIGTDVTLNARRIVIDGVDLPPGAWRQALAKFDQSGVRPNQP